MQPEARYANLKELAATLPDFGGAGSSPPTDAKRLEWLGRLSAIVEETDMSDGVGLRVAADGLGTILHVQNVGRIRNILFRALARAEAAAPLSARGAFIAAGNPYDAISAIGSILEGAAKEVMIVDPYLSDKVLSGYAIFAKPHVPILLLGAEGHTKAPLMPAAGAWIAQYGDERPLNLRVAPAVSLHDRLIIIDRETVWDLTQSLNKFADRSPATLAKADAEQALLKVGAYGAIFDNAKQILPAT